MQSYAYLSVMLSAAVVAFTLSAWMMRARIARRRIGPFAWFEHVWLPVSFLATGLILVLHYGMPDLDADYGVILVAMFFIILVLATSPVGFVLAVLLVPPLVFLGILSYNAVVPVGFGLLAGNIAGFLLALRHADSKI